MRKYRSAKLYMALFPGLLCIVVASHLSDAQNPPVPAVEVARSATPTMRTTHAPSPMDDFAGLSYTDDQKAQIRKVHQDMQTKLDIVARDPKLDSDQRAAMLDGYQRLEYRQIFTLLTPEQQAEVRKKIAARREQEHKKQMPQTAPSK